jgi:Mg/Co/Ni transporter MgtE
MSTKNYVYLLSKHEVIDGSVCSDPDEVIDEFANNRGSSIIVVDEKNKPVGRILADDLVDALASTSDTQGFAQGSGAL